MASIGFRKLVCKFLSLLTKCAKGCHGIMYEGELLALENGLVFCQLSGFLFLQCSSGTFCRYALKLRVGDRDVWLMVVPQHRRHVQRHRLAAIGTRQFGVANRGVRQTLCVNVAGDAARHTINIDVGEQMRSGGQIVDAAINASGQIVGSSSGSGILVHGVLFSNGTITDLGVIAGATMSFATAISANGKIVGYGDSPAGQYQPIYFTNGTAQNIGVPSGDYSGEAYGINSSGVAVGSGATNRSGYYSFTSTNGGAASTLSLVNGSFTPVAINNYGLMVGTANTATGGIGAFANSAQLSLLTTNMATSGFATLYEATGVSDTGYIIGYGMTLTGANHVLTKSNNEIAAALVHEAFSCAPPVKHLLIVAAGRLFQDKP